MSIVRSKRERERERERERRKNESDTQREREERERVEMYFVSGKRKRGRGKRERDMHEHGQTTVSRTKPGPSFNSRSGCMCARHLFCYEAKQPNLKLKTRPKQLLGSLPIVFALPGMRRKKYLKNLVGGRGK